MNNLARRSVGRLQWARNRGGLWKVRDATGQSSEREGRFLKKVGHCGKWQNQGLA